MESNLHERSALEVAEGYYRAMVEGDAPALRALFDPRAMVIGHSEGDFLWQDLDSFIAETESVVGQHGEEVCVVEGLRLDGDIACVAVRGRYVGLWFVDHLSMVEDESRWRIVGKTFHVVS
jgi:hypothetical protein